MGRETADGFDFDPDGLLVSSYSWRDARYVVHGEVLRWRLPERAAGAC